MKHLLTVLLVLTMSQHVLAQQPDVQELKFIKDLFNRIQPATFANNKEYCGYIGYDKNGVLIATTAYMGKENSCMPQEPPLDLEIVGSYHTHGAFSAEADSELPSSDDMMGDMEEDIDGFIATPGGRIWYIDTIDNIAEMVCERHCIMSDPNFDATLLDPVSDRYTLAQLQQRELEQQ